MPERKPSTFQVTALDLNFIRQNTQCISEFIICARLMPKKNCQVFVQTLMIILEILMLTIAVNLENTH